MPANFGESTAYHNKSEQATTVCDRMTDKHVPRTSTCMAVEGKKPLFYFVRSYQPQVNMYEAMFVFGVPFAAMLSVHT